MTDKEKIKQEIERRIVQAEEFAERAKGANDDSSKLSWNFVATQNKSLLQFIDSLPEPASEDLEEAAKNFIINEFPPYVTSDNDADVESAYNRAIATFIAGAEWQHGKDFDDLLQSEMKFPKEYYERGRADMREEMMKDVVEAESRTFSNIHGTFLHIKEGLNTKDDDKVKIIIVKTEQQ